MDDADQPVGVLDKLLLQATPFSIDDLAAMAKRSGGCAVPAHINRNSFSILSNLGFIPDGLFSAVELAASLPCPQIDRKYHKLFSTDAHNLGSISEPIHKLTNITNPTQFVHHFGHTFASE